VPETGIRAVFTASVVRERTALGLSQRALAREAGLSYAAACDTENGKHGPSPATAAMIAVALGKELGAMLAREEAGRG
jgi:transcriptional regulator with XRE-family HTH domain